ncbi:TetR/AcrR family transcriptional regulator [Microbacterium sp. NPDC058345]|uniref:TetR/AcrR family transcriptional regulator n=1 Tax=Microbacterium sp. NPDC058345 TaxID=3346455 RepID=UPI00364EAD33
MTELTGPHRDALIDATIAEFATAGYESASLNRIIRAAGISKSSFYHAVGSKAELLDAVVDTLIADVRARWTPPSPGEFQHDAFWPLVDRVLGELAALTAEDRSLELLGRIFYLPATGAADARSALLESVRLWVGEVLRVGAASGAVRDDVPVAALAAAAFGMLRGLDEWALRAMAEPTPSATAESADNRRRHGGVSAPERSVDTAESARLTSSAPGLLLRGMLTAPGGVPA